MSAEHRLPTWRLSWVREGQVSFESRGERLRLVPGRLLVLGPSTPHRVLADGRTAVVEYFQLDLEANETGAYPLPLLRLLSGAPNAPAKLLAASRIGRQASLRREWAAELRGLLEKLPNHARPPLESSKWNVDPRAKAETKPAPPATIAPSSSVPAPGRTTESSLLGGLGHADALALALRHVPSSVGRRPRRARAFAEAS